MRMHGHGSMNYAQPPFFYGSRHLSVMPSFAVSHLCRPGS